MATVETVEDLRKLVAAVRGVKNMAYGAYFGEIWRRDPGEPYPIRYDMLSVAVDGGYFIDVHKTEIMRNSANSLGDLLLTRVRELLNKIAPVHFGCAVVRGL